MKPLKYKRSGKISGAISVALTLLILPLFLSGQKSTRVRIEHADMLRLDTKEGQTIQRLTGNVILRQDSTIFRSDTASLDDRNNLEAIGNIHITYADSVEIFGDYLYYDGNSRIASLDGNVKMADNRATLYTDHLIYDRRQRLSYYLTGGRIVDEENVLTSITGRYFMDVSDFFFKDSVVLTNPDYVMYSDTLLYNTRSEIVTISGPTDIYGEKDYIYSEKGWYDTRNDITMLTENNRIRHEEQYLVADTVFYDSGRGYGYARGSIWLKDTVQDVILEGMISEYFKKEGFAYITGDALAILIDKEDSLYLHADTFRMELDSAEKARFIHAYHRMKFYRDDLQGKCDSMVYSVRDSVITMLYSPTLWSEANQLTSDTIFIHVSGNSIDSLVMVNSAFIISRDLGTSFNQIKGRQMRGYLKDGQLRRINVVGNAETVYFVREEDSTLVGINMCMASEMGIIVEDDEIRDIIYYSVPDGTLYPEKDIKKEETILKGFHWISERRPRNREEIFIWGD